MRFCFQSVLVSFACALGLSAESQTGPVLTWIPNSSVKLEQLTGDLDWADLARGVTNPTASQTVTRFHILGQGLGYSFNRIRSTNGTFNFTDRGTNSGGFGATKFYRLRSSP